MPQEVGECPSQVAQLILSLFQVAQLLMSASGYVACLGVTLSNLYYLRTFGKGGA